MSMTSRFLKPERARSLRSSQPSPPAPTTNTLTYSPSSSLNWRQKNFRPRDGRRGPRNSNDRSLHYEKINPQNHRKRRAWRGRRFDLRAGLEDGADDIARPGEELVQVPPSLLRRGVPHSRSRRRRRRHRSSRPSPSAPSHATPLLSSPLPPHSPSWWGGPPSHNTAFYTSYFMRQSALFPFLKYGKYY